MATTASVYNTSRTTRQILRRHRKYKASLILHLHNNHFRFERQNGMFLFDSPVKQFIKYIRDQKVPADLIDVLTESGVQFFEGCLLVEIHDHRNHAVAEHSGLSGRDLDRISAGVHGNASKGILLEPTDVSDSTLLGTGALASTLFYLQEGGRYGAQNLVNSGSRSGPGGGGAANGGVEIYRIVLHPTSETLWSDIKMLDELAGSSWTDQEALEVEAKILALTAPPLCLTPDSQATRIANLMLSSTAPPSAYSPGKDSPFKTGKKRTANSIEMEKEEANHQRREKIMRLMEHGLRSYVPAGSTPATANIAHPAASHNSQAATGATSSTFVPTFGRMAFIEKWRMGKNMGVGPHGLQSGALGAHASDNGSKKEAKSNASGDKDDGDDAANAIKKPPSKKKKKAQREKEEAEAAAAAEAAKKKAEEEASALSTSGAKKPKKKMTKKEREEKERREQEEKAQAEERERLEKEAATLAAAAAEAAAAASSTAKPVKGKSKKKQKEEAAAAAAAAAAASAALAAITPSGGGSAPDSPDKDKKPSPKKTGSKKPAATTTAGKKPKSPVKAEKRTSNVTGLGINGSENAGTPMMHSATPSVQSTPTAAHRAIPSQQQPQHHHLQQQAGMLNGHMQGALNNGQSAMSYGNNANGMSFGMPLMNNGGNLNNGYPATSNAMQQALASAQFGGGMPQGLGLGVGMGGNNNNNNMMNFGGMNMGHQPHHPAMSQMMGLMLPGSNVANYPNQHQQHVQQHQQQQQPQQQQQQQQQQQGGGGGGGLGDMPVGVGLSNLGNWGSSS